MNPEQEINELKRRLGILETSISINRNLDNQSKDLMGQIISERIGDVLWDNVSFTSSFATASITTTSATVTVTIASPAVFTSTSHGFSANSTVMLSTTGTLPTGLTAGTVYYVISAGLTANDFELSATLGGSAINTSGSQSGVHSVRKSELLDANGRESDTSGGKRFRPERESRYRATFYINSGLSASTIYITSPAVSAATTIGTTMIDTNKSYVGVKIVNGVIYMVSSVAGTESTILTTTTITDTSTNLLEIDYYVTHAVAKFNDVIIGDIACNLLSVTPTTFFPFLTSVKSGDGTAVNLTIEGYEFLQNRQ